MFSDSFDSESPDLTIDHLRSGQISRLVFLVSADVEFHTTALNTIRLQTIQEYLTNKNGSTLAIWPILHNEFNLFLQRPDKPKQPYMLDIL